MSPDQITHAIACIEAGLANGAAIKRIVAEGHGESSRDVPLGLNAADSAAILQAALEVLKDIQSLTGAQAPT